MFPNRNDKTAVDRGHESGRTRRQRHRRSHRRFRDQRVSVSVVDDELGDIQFDCLNISPVGVYLRTDFLLLPGDEVNLRIGITPWHRPFDVTGKVIRVDTGETGLPPGMGIAFHRIATTDSKELKLFLMRRFLSHG